VPHPFDLIIFDCDGVLIDSEVISTGTLRETLAAHGLNVDIDYVKKTYLGRSLAVVKSDYLRLVGRELAEDFEDDFLDRLFAAYRRELQPMPGVNELLAGLTRPFCMATSSGERRAAVSLEVTGLAPFFTGKVFCASMVARGKPAPDLFLHAAERFGAQPARCLVIEDSEVGLLAGKNAGMEVWRFVGGSHFEVKPPINRDSDICVFGSMEAVAAALHED